MSRKSFTSEQLIRLLKEAAEQSNGLFVERVMLRTECGTQWREAGATGFELNDEEDLPGWGGPLFDVCRTIWNSNNRERDEAMCESDKDVSCYCAG